jgi:UDP-N-acetylglucosamine acyltransferase
MHGMKIHPSAIIDPGAELGANVEVGPFSYIGPHCKVGDNTKIMSNVVLQEYVTLGRDCQVSPGAVLGGAPQDLRFKGEESYVVVGNGTMIRECVTLNRASGEGETTRIGNKCIIMAYSHVAHNCTVGNEVALANCIQLGGHVEVGDYAFLGGICAVHQFVKIGKMAIVSGSSATRQDIPPFSMSDGRPAVIVGINKVGLKRRGVSLEGRTRLKKAYHLLWFAGLNQTQAIEAIQNEIEMDENVQELVAFVQNSARGIRRPLDVMRTEMDRPESSLEANDALNENLVECT